MHVLVICLAIASALGIVLVESMAGEGAGAPPAPSRAPELDRIAQSVGTWDAEVSLMGQTAKGVETCRMGVGGLWLVTEFEGEMMGAPFEGHGLTGFDAAKGKVVGMWVDSMGGPWTTMEGTFSKDGKTLTSTANGFDEAGKPSVSRHVVEFGKDERTFRVFQAGPDGKEEVEVMSIRYTRR